MSKKIAKERFVRSDKEERDRILLEQLPQVHFVARRIHGRLPRWVPLEDIVHAGVIGLIDALNKFDHSKHVHFNIYAKFRIRGAILDSLRAMDWGPRDLRCKARKLEEARRKLSLCLSRAATEEELATELGLELWEFQQLRSDLDGLEVGSLHRKYPADGQDEDLCDYIPDPSDDTPFLHCMSSQTKGFLFRAAVDLTKKEYQVVVLYYFRDLTMKQVGAVLGIGESRVSQIRASAVAHLRSRMEELMSPGRPPARAVQAGQ